jgi:hypothetical protein
MALANRVVEEIERRPGISDRQLSEIIFGTPHRSTQINGECRHLENQGRLKRRKVGDAPVGNYPVRTPPKLKIAFPPPGGRSGLGGSTGKEAAPLPAPAPAAPVDGIVLSEDQLKKVLQGWLEAQGWIVKVAWAKTPGIDLLARRGDQRWIIEAKGSGSLDAMRVNYFLGVLGETLQRMNDPEAAYSIALPDMKQFRNLWTRLPILAKQRTNITALFVRGDEHVEQA